MEKVDLDSALREVGRIGRYQIFIFFLIFIPILLTGVYSVAYVFTAGDLNYRCRIDDCDRALNSNGVYRPHWLRNAVPFDTKSERPEQCYRYNLTQTNIDMLKCSASDFAHVKIKCDDFVYETDERTIVNDMNLHCDENKWKLALVGTIHNLGHFINLLFSGYMSDQYGRLTVLILSAVASGIFGIVRTFSWDYVSFMVFEFMESVLGSGGLTAGFILIVEIVKPEHRAWLGAIGLSVMSLGKVILGLSAMMLDDWKILLRVTYALSFVALAYFWLVPESLRWLLSQGRNTETARLLLKISNTNNTKISNELRDLLENRPQDLVLNADSKKPNNENMSTNYQLKLLLKYPRLLIRLALCAFCWIIVVMVFYGLSLIAVSIGGNKYTDFMLVQFMEILAAMSMPLVSNKLGRKKILIGSFLLSGVTLLVYTFIGDNYGLKLTLFLIGKFAISVTLANIYVYNSELFPTSLRHTLLGICSACGRIGSMVSPQAPLLNLYVPNLSMYIFGSGALLTALVVLQFPETLNIKMPDTIEEALNIGKEKSTETLKS